MQESVSQVVFQLHSLSQTGATLHFFVRFEGPEKCLL